MALPTSPTFWLEGLTATSVIVVAVVLGLVSFIKARKLNAKLLSTLGITIIFIGFLYLGPFVDFLTVIITGSNISIPPWGNGVYGILSYIWIGPALVLAMYIGGVLLIPKGKWFVVAIYAVLAGIFTYFLLFDTANVFSFDIVPGEIIDSSFNLVLWPPAFLLMALFIVSLIVFHGIGFLIKGIKSTGILKKKFLLLSFGFILFSIAGAGDALVNPSTLFGLGLVLVRLLMITSIVLMYLGLRT